MHSRRATTAEGPYQYEQGVDSHGPGERGRVEQVRSGSLLEGCAAYWPDAPEAEDDGVEWLAEVSAVFGGTDPSSRAATTLEAAGSAARRGL